MERSDTVLLELVSVYKFKCKACQQYCYVDPVVPTEEEIEGFRRNKTKAEQLLKQIKESDIEDEDNDFTDDVDYDLVMDGVDAKKDISQEDQDSVKYVYIEKESFETGESEGVLCRHPYEVICDNCATVFFSHTHELDEEDGN